MSGSTTDDGDDGWAELLNELGLENPEPTSSSQPYTDSSDDAESLEAGFDEDAPELGMSQDLPIQASDDAEESQSDEDDEESDDESQPKKKRRRRRRRKKKSGDETPTVAEANDDEETDFPEPDVEESAEEFEPEEEHHSADLARELIAHWDVPPWEQIVAGLYRPNH